MPTESAAPSLSQPTYFPELIHLLSRTPPSTSTYHSTPIIAAPLLVPEISAISRSLPPGAERVDWAGTTSRPENRRVQQLNFKPIKRLPHPPAPGRLDAAPAQVLSSSSSNSQLPSSEILTSSSTVSLSKYQFPHPPLTHSPPSEPPISRSQPQPSKPEPAAAAPKILHYRGASFDLLNPHDSLRLSEVHTSPEREHDNSDYFRTIPSLEDLIQEEMARTQRGGGAAPARALFGNYNDAFLSIARGNSGLPVNQQEASYEPALESQAPNVPTSPPSRQPASQLDAADEQSRARGPRPAAENEAPTRSPFRRLSQRLSSMARFGRKDSTPEVEQPSSVSIAQTGTTPPQIAPQNFGRSPSEERHVQMHREYTLMCLEGLVPQEVVPDNDDFVFDYVERVRVSHGAGFVPNVPRLADRESFYEDSDDGSHRPPSTIVGNRHSMAYGHSHGEIDYSDATMDFSSYPYRFGPSARDTGSSDFPRTNTEDSNPQRDTTVTNIIQGYRYGTVYEDSPSILAAYGAEGDISQQPLGVGVFQDDESTADYSDDEQLPKGNVSTSGFSQFDFGLNQPSPLSDGSVAEGPDFSSPESRPHPVKVAGPAPTAPLPPVPDSRDIVPLFTRRFHPQGHSDLGSNVTSYGETRNLLHLEDPEVFGTPREVMPEVPEHSIEDSTFQTNRLVSSESEFPFNLESAGMSTPTKQQGLRGTEPFQSSSSIQEAGRATGDAEDNGANDISGISNVSDHQGTHYRDSSVSVPPLFVTPKSKGHSPGPSTRTSYTPSSTRLKHKSTFSNVLGAINNANDLAESADIDKLRTNLQGERCSPDRSIQPTPVEVYQSPPSAPPTIWTRSPSPPLQYLRVKADTSVGDDDVDNLRTSMVQGEPIIRSIQPTPVEFYQSPTSAIPAMWARPSTPPLQARRPKANTIAEDDGDPDWVTEADQSRPNLFSTTLTSMGSYSRIDSNTRDFSAMVHPPNSRFNVSQYRKHAPVTSTEAFLVPEYQYGPGSEFMSRNATRSPTRTEQSPGAGNDLRSPVLSTPTRVPRRHAQTERAQLIDEKLLSSEPNDDIIYETTPLMSYEPMSERENSFSKVQELGPKANLTGSPFGTGMRDAGSSVVQSSSPFFHSTPHHLTYKSSPLGLVSDSERSNDTTRFQPQTTEADAALSGLVTPATAIGKGKAVIRDAGQISRADNRKDHYSLRTPVMRENDYNPVASLSAPPKVHIRPSTTKDVQFDENLPPQPSSEPSRLVLPKPHQGTIRSPDRSRFSSRAYHTLHRPSNAANKPEDAIELQTPHAMPSFPRPLRLASRAHNTVSADTLNTQKTHTTRYSDRVPSHYRSHETIAPLHPDHRRLYDARSGQHRRNFSGSNLHPLMLTRRNPEELESQRQVMVKEAYDLQARYSWLLVLTVGILPGVGLCVWSGCFDSSISYISYGRVGAVGRLQKNVAGVIAIVEVLVLATLSITLGILANAGRI